MSAGVYNFIIQRGATFNDIFQWTDLNNNPIDLANYTLKFVAREAPDPLSPQLIQYISPCLQLSLTVPQNGQFQITLLANDTATYQWTNATYDLVATSPAGVVAQILRGSITVTPLV